MKLQIGCGNQLCVGFLNTDIKSPVNIPNDVDFAFMNINDIPWMHYVDRDYMLDDNQIGGKLINSDSVEHIRAIHVMEHVGASVEDYIRIWKEMYRVCKDGAIIDIIVPDPNNDNFHNDPTHVRKITEAGLAMFSKKFNLDCIKNGYSNSTFALDNDFDFELAGSKEYFNESAVNALGTMGIDKNVGKMLFRNVVDQTLFKLRVVK